MAHRRGPRARTLLATLSALLALIVASAPAGAAVDLTTLYSQDVAKAVFARHYNTVWNFIDPKYRSAVNKSRWEGCVGKLVAQSSSYRIKSIRVALTRRVHSSLPLLGRVVLVDVGLQVLYTLPGSKTLQAGLESAFWVKEKGKWYAVWLPAQLSAYKAGKCSPASLY